MTNHSALGKILEFTQANKKNPSHNTTDRAVSGGRDPLLNVTFQRSKITLFTLLSAAARRRDSSHTYGNEQREGMNDTTCDYQTVDSFPFRLQVLFPALTEFPLRVTLHRLLPAIIIIW